MTNLAATSPADSPPTWASTVTLDGTLVPGYVFEPGSACDLSRPLQWNRQAQAAGIRRKVVCTSLFTDFLSPKLLVGSAEHRTLLLPLVEATPHLDWLIVTDMPGTLKHCAPEAGFPRNLWLGVHLHTQLEADLHLFHLLQAKASVRFVVCAPLLEAIDLLAVQHDSTVEIDTLTGRHGVARPLAGTLSTRLDWVIVGGAADGVLDEDEEQEKCHLDDIRYVVQQCQEAGCPVFVSQLGADPYWSQQADDQHWLMSQTHPSGADINQWPQDLRVQQIPVIIPVFDPKGERHVS